MQTNDAVDAGQAAALNSVVPELEWLERLLAAENAGQVKALESFASDAGLRRLEELAERQRNEFDALDFVGRLRLGSGSNLWSDEEFHSNLLAWLLDPRESHGIEERFLMNFLQETGAPSKMQASDWTRAIVIREWANQVDGQEGYLDILILNESEQTICAIENKVFSGEHSEQLTRYRKALADSYPDFTRHHVFLTPRGTLPYREEEREHWIPATYATVLNIVQQIVEDDSSSAKDDVRAFLSQYATALRRNIVPDTNTNIREMVRAIYSEHKEAIDLIIQHKPDYIVEMKEMFRAAIKQQSPKWILDWEGVREIVFFRSSDWDDFGSFKTGTGWGNPGSLVTFGFDLREDCPTLICTLGPGSDQRAREAIHRAIGEHGKLFSRAGRNLQSSYTRLDVKGPVSDDSEVSGWLDTDTTQAKIEAWVQNFAENQFPAMNEVIVNCFREYEAEQRQNQ